MLNQGAVNRQTACIDALINSPCRIFSGGAKGYAAACSDTKRYSRHDQRMRQRFGEWLCW